MGKSCNRMMAFQGCLVYECYVLREQIPLGFMASMCPYLKSQKISTVPYHPTPVSTARIWTRVGWTPHFPPCLGWDRWVNALGGRQQSQAELRDLLLLLSWCLLFWRTAIPVFWFSVDHLTQHHWFFAGHLSLAESKNDSGCLMTAIVYSQEGGKNIC